MEFLAEIAVSDLFHFALERVKKNLTIEQCYKIYNFILVGYEGSRVSENIGMVSSMLHRGSEIYLKMTKSLLLSLLEKNQIHDFMNEFNSKSLEDHLGLMSGRLEIAYHSL